MKILNNEQVNAVNGAGFWDTIEKFFTDNYDNDIGFKVYENDDFKLGVGYDVGREEVSLKGVFSW